MKIGDIYLIAVSVFLVVSCTDVGIQYDNDSVPPSEGLETYELVSGYEMKLFASEPLIQDPVDMCVDAKGVMYVVEMSGYPTDISHTGKIRVLRDEDEDGVMDKSILFAEGLMLPNGLLPWKEGVLVTDAPYVLYLADEDGDGVSDVRDTILSGFSLSNPHVNVNNPVYGLDNWVYLSHFGRIGTRKYGTEFGDEGEVIRFWGREGGPELPKNANGKHVRFKPDGGGLEMGSVRGQFGHTFDEWGHHFLTHNSNHIYQDVLASRYISRNSDAVISQSSEDISDHGNSTEVYQITTNPDRQLTTPVGLSTATSGLTYYDGGLFVPPYDSGVTFVAESVSNLVHSDRLTERGATYVASRIEKGREFLASKDYWARPVNMYVGPDGALYVLDYYRRIIEHPEWMSEEAIEAGDLYDGHDMGRIFRIVPTGTGQAEWTKGLDFGSSSSEELVHYLSHENGWWRRQAQRLLVERQDQLILGELKEEIRHGKSVWGRLHSLWTLEGLGALEEEDVLVGLGDESAGIRENAVRLSESFLDAKRIKERLYEMSGDRDAKVRYQLLNTLGSVSGEQAAEVREELLFGNLADEWMQRAALTAGELDVWGLLQKVKGSENDAFSSSYDGLVSQLSKIIGSGRDVGKVKELLREGMDIQGELSSSRQASLMGGLTSGMLGNESMKVTLGGMLDEMKTTFFTHSSPEIRGYVMEVVKGLGLLDERDSREWAEIALSKSRDKTLSPAYRSQMIELLTIGDLEDKEKQLQSFIVPKEEPLVQISGLKVYGELEGVGVSEYVLAHWQSMTPEVRDVGLETFMTEKERVRKLVEALESGKISKSALGWSRTVQLNRYSDEELRERAQAILTKNESGAVISEYESALSDKGDIDKGYEVYQANCSICHQVRGKIGISYGPDLGTVHNWEREDLLANILQPELSIAPGYDIWELELNGGEKVQGMIKSETSNAVELRTGPELEKTVNRQNVKEIQSLPGVSMMPGFGGVLDPEKMSDLIAFLQNSDRVL